MRVVLASTARFHFLAAASQLKRRGLLGKVVSGLLPSRVLEPGITAEDVVCVPFWRTLNYVCSGRVAEPLVRWLEWKSNDAIDQEAAFHLDGCDVLITMAGTGMKAGACMQRQGGQFVIDRPVIHLRQQDELLARVYEALGVTYHPISPSKISAAEEEYAMADGILACSQIVAESLIRGGVDRNRVHVLPLGVELTRFYPDGSPAEEGFVLGFAGNVTIQKGIHVLANAIAKIKDPCLRVWLAGNVHEEARPYLKVLEQNCSLELLGVLSQDELRSRMSRSHLFVLPSVQDGFGMVATQAMACGCPVVVSRNAGVCEVVVDGKTGLLFDSGDSDMLAERIALLKRDSDLRQSMGRNALASVMALGGWNAYGDQLIEVLEGMTAAANQRLSGSRFAMSGA